MAESLALNMDCMAYMRTLPDKAFDLAVVDPPYGDGGRIRLRQPVWRSLWPIHPG